MKASLFNVEPVRCYKGARYGLKAANRYVGLATWLFFRFPKELVRGSVLLLLAGALTFGTQGCTDNDSGDRDYITDGDSYDPYDDNLWGGDAGYTSEDDLDGDYNNNMIIGDADYVPDEDQIEPDYDMMMGDGDYVPDEDLLPPSDQDQEYDSDLVSGDQDGEIEPDAEIDIDFHENLFLGDGDDLRSKDMVSPSKNDKKN